MRNFNELPLICKNLKGLDKFNGSVIAITGAAGLIGTYIIEIIMYFNRTNGGNISVVAVDKNAERLKERFSRYEGSRLFKTIICDVNRNGFEKYFINSSVDYIIHAASNTSPIEYANDPVSTITTNVIGTYNLLEYAVKNKIKRFMFCSSVEKYGSNRGDVDNFTEDYCGYLDSNVSRSAYPSGKIAAESMCCAYNSQYGIDYVIARIGRIYGPTVILNDTKAPTQFIMNAVRGEDIVLMSDGMQHYSYCYVGDCASAMLTVLSLGENGGAYNIADPNSKVHLKDFAMLAAKVGGTKCVFANQKALENLGYSKISKATMDTAKLEKLGWRPQIGLEKGIELTVNYLKGNDE